VASIVVTPPQPPVVERPHVVVPPPIPNIEPVVARAPAHERQPEPRDDGGDSSRVARAAITEALAPVQQTVRELLRRIEELEKRPAQTVVTAAPAEGYRQPQPSYAGAIAVPINTSLAPRPPTLDIAAIERDTSIQVDGALDGRKRKRRLAITFVLLLLVVFGGLFGALAHSYTPAQSLRDTARPRLASAASPLSIAQPGRVEG
jgi:hypothetical protein